MPTALPRKDYTPPLRLPLNTHNSAASASSSCVPSVTLNTFFCCIRDGRARRRWMFELSCLCGWGWAPGDRCIPVIGWLGLEWRDFRWQRPQSFPSRLAVWWIRAARSERWPLPVCCVTNGGPVIRNFVYIYDIRLRKIHQYIHLISGWLDMRLAAEGTNIEELLDQWAHCQHEITKTLIRSAFCKNCPPSYNWPWSLCKYTCLL